MTDPERRSVTEREQIEQAFIDGSVEGSPIDHDGNRRPERRSVTVETLAAAMLEPGIGLCWHDQGRQQKIAVAIFAALPAEPTEPAEALDFREYDSLLFAIDEVRLADAEDTPWSDGFRQGWQAARDAVVRKAESAGLDQKVRRDFDAAVEDVHRAFCEPDHELVGAWDRDMAEALRRRGLTIARLAPSEPRADSEGLREALERLADAISGERRDWHKVEVRPDDIAAVLAALRREQPAAEGEREVLLIRALALLSEWTFEVGDTEPRDANTTRLIYDIRAALRREQPAAEREREP